MSGGSNARPQTQTASAPRGRAAVQHRTRDRPVRTRGDRPGHRQARQDPARRVAPAGCPGRAGRARGARRPPPPTGPADTCTVATPSGGLHLYYRAPAEDERLRNTAGTLGWKVDTRAHGGYVVAPGSVVDGRAIPVVVSRPAHRCPRGYWTRSARRRSRHHRTGQCRSGRVAGRGTWMPQCAWNASGSGGPQQPTQRHPLRRRYRPRATRGRRRAHAEEHERELLTAAGRHIAVGAYNEHQARATIASGLAPRRNRPRQVA